MIAGVSLMCDAVLSDTHHSGNQANDEDRKNKWLDVDGLLRQSYNQRWAMACGYVPNGSTIPWNSCVHAKGVRARKAILWYTYIYFLNGIVGAPHQ